MAEEPEVLKIKLARKRILSMLNIMYPTPLQLGTLYDRALGYIDPTYDFSLYQKDIMYLKAKGYIEFIDDIIGGAGEFRKKVISLTAEGKEIAERPQIDDALEI